MSAADEAIGGLLDALRGPPVGAPTLPDGPQRDVLTLHGWCDSSFGWGPTVPDGSALTMCFCATVLEMPSAVVFMFFGIPRLLAILREPVVKPAFSYLYHLKLMTTLACMGCGLVLALLADPPSVALRVSLTLATSGWCLALALLVVGHFRHLPQLTCVRAWWVGQFGVNVVIFLMHAELHTFPVVHLLRGIYSGFCILLALLSIQPEDQPRYSAVIITPPGSASPALLRRGATTRANISTPLLVPGVAARMQRSGSYTWGNDEGAMLSSSAPNPSSILQNSGVFFGESTDSDDDHNRSLERKLSTNLFISGASKSRYAAPLQAWNDTLYGSGSRAGSGSQLSLLHESAATMSESDDFELHE